MSLIAPTLQAWFTERLITQRNSSPQTIASYRDTLRLLLAFASERTGKQPCELDIDDLDAPLIGAFLTHLEQDRGNSARTRNARLAAIHSLYRYMALRHPEHLQTIGRVIAIPFKRHEHNTVNYLNLDEIKALLRAPDRTTWLGRRDHALLVVMIQTGVRVSELAGLRISDVHLGAVVDQLPHGIETPRARGNHHRRLPVPSRRKGVGAGRHQALHQCRVSICRGERHRRLAVLVGGVGVGAGVEQRLGHAAFAEMNRPRQRGGAVGLRRIHVRFRPQ